MDFKNAAAVCLISLFSATLVVLVARSLDSQAASQLEPQLTRIAEELHALRKQGGIAATPGDSTQTETVGNGLIVYYFHANARCPACRSIESQTHETLQNHFASQLSTGEVIWKIVNYEQAAAKEWAEKFQLQMPVVVLARMKDGKVEDWKRLDEVWAMVGDKPAFTTFLRGKIERMLAPDKPQARGQATPAPNANRVPPKETPAIPISP